MNQGRGRGTGRDIRGTCPVCPGDRTGHTPIGVSCLSRPVLSGVGGGYEAPVVRLAPMIDAAWQWTGGGSSPGVAGERGALSREASICAESK